jgi:hypothetical protein
MKLTDFAVPKNAKKDFFLAPQARAAQRSAPKFN